MTHELTRSGDGARIACAEDHIIEATLDQLDDLLTSLRSRALRFRHESSKLALSDSVVVAKLLLLFELTSIVRVFTTTAISVLPWRLRSTISGLT
jgi:hypothetical protein